MSEHCQKKKYPEVMNDLLLYCRITKSDFPLTIEKIKEIVLAARQADILYADHADEIPLKRHDLPTKDSYSSGQAIGYVTFKEYFTEYMYAITKREGGGILVTPHGAIDIFADILGGRCPCEKGDRTETFLTALEIAHGELALARFQWKPTARAEKRFAELLGAADIAFPTNQTRAKSGHARVKMKHET